MHTQKQAIETTKTTAEKTKTKVAAIQMASGPNVGANLIEARRLINLAVKAGAELVVLPENFAIMGMKETDKVTIREADGHGQIQDFLAEQAQKNNVWLVGGTVPLVAVADNKVRAACLVYDNQGRRVARYDKTHLFDVRIVDTGDQYVESATIEAGNQVVVVDTPFAKLGVAVCYDLRFPELFRNMLAQGVEVIVLPSAFTRDRQSYYHVNGRESHGDSMIVDPWGHILDRLTSGSGFVMGEIDLNYLRNTRKNFPALEHRKFVCEVN